MSPHETYFLLPTTSIEKQKVANNDYIQFTVVDFPANAPMTNEVQQII